MKKTFKFGLVLMLMLVLMAFCVSAAEYEIYVGGVQITDENSADVLGDGKVSYDVQSNTLLLDNAGISAALVVNNSADQPVTSVIYTKQELNILVKGICSVMTDVSNSYKSYNDFCIYSEVEGVSEGMTRKALTITGYDDEAVLVLSSVHTNNYTSSIYTMCADVKIENVKLTCYSGRGLQSNSIYASDAAVYINNSTVECYPNYSQTQNCGIASGRGVSILGTSNVKVEGKNSEYYGEETVSSYGILTLGTLEIGGDSTVNLRAGGIACSGNANSFGVCAGRIVVGNNSNLVANSSSISSNDTEASYVSIGVYALDILATDNAVIEGSGMYSSTASAGVYGVNITVEDYAKIYGSSPYSATVRSAIASDNPIGGVGAGVYDKETTEYLTYVPSTENLPGYFVNELSKTPQYMVATAYMEYNTWVGGVRITSENEDDVFGDGTVSYDHKTRVLTLNNATITGSYIFSTNTYSSTDEDGQQVDVIKTKSAGIYSRLPLIVNVIGDVVVDCTDDASEFNYGMYLDRYYSTCSEQNEIVGIGDDASLTVKSGGKEESNGIYIDDSGCLIKDINLDVQAGEAKTGSVAMLVSDADCSLEINNSNANFSGGNVLQSSDILGTGGLGGGSIKITNGSNVTASSGNVAGGTKESACAGAVIIGYFDVLEGSTFTANGGDVSTESGTAQSFGLFVLGIVNIGDGCELNAYGGDVHHSGEAAIDSAQSIGFGLTIGEVTIGDNAVMNAYGGYSDGGSAGVYITDAETTPEYDETVVFKTETGVLNAGTTNTNENAINVGIYTENPIENGTVKNDKTGEVLVYNGGVYTDADGNLVSNTTVNGGIVLFGDYNLIVAGVQVTEMNKDDILGDLDGEKATVYYDHETKTLTLDNAEITEYYDMDGGYVGILRVGDLNINLVGENKVYVNSYEEMPYTTVGIATFGDVVITSEESAYLEVVAGDSNGESYGIFAAPYDSEEFTNDITISGRANVVARSGNIAYEGNCYTAGACAFGTLNVVDGANLYGYSGEASCTANPSYYAYGVSVGLMSYSTMNINTTGTVYGYGKKSDFVFGGIGVFNALIVENGAVVGEVADDIPENAIASGIVTWAESENVIVKAGLNADALTENPTWAMIDESVGGGYFAQDSTLARYVELLPVKGVCGLETVTDTKTVTGAATGSYVVIKSVDTDENVMFAFASYDENGRMIDYKTALASDANEENEISVSLDLEGAVKVKAFMFENSTSFSPMGDYIEKVYFQTAEE